MSDVYSGELSPDQPRALEGEPSKVRRPEVLSGGGGGGGSTRLPPHSGGGDDGGDEEDEGMLRMSFMEHLEELRARIIAALKGFGVIFLLCVIFSDRLWLIVQAPAAAALEKLGVKNGLTIINPMEGFSIIWVWTPLVFSLFLGAPWILWQVWKFIAPGLYHKEKKWAVPFVLCTAGLFIGGGLFAYFVAFRYGLAFLLGIGLFANVTPMVSIDYYFDLFVDVMLGIGAVFELPVLIFFLTLLRIVSPSFLMKHSRYAILAIVIIAAIITPTPDVFNLMLFAVPMCLLYFVGVFAGYLLVLRREKRKFPWAVVIKWLGIVLLVLAALVAFAIIRLHLHWTPHWPFLIK